jgi:hypothetical protein
MTHPTVALLGEMWITYGPPISVSAACRQDKAASARITDFTVLF